MYGNSLVRVFISFLLPPRYERLDYCQVEEVPQPISAESGVSAMEGGGAKEEERSPQADLRLILLACWKVCTITIFLNLVSPKLSSELS